MARATVEAMREIDLRPLLPSVRTPTLVVHRRGDRMISIEGGRQAARDRDREHCRQA